MQEEFEVTVKELKQQIDNRAKIQLIDVREPYEFDFCRIEGSKLMSMSQLGNRIKELDPEDEYVFYCHVGERSGWVVNYLRQLGFKKVKNLRGGIDQWAVEIDPSVPRY
jgi:adenylyltransferase/sulfurtransferase